MIIAAALAVLAVAGDDGREATVAGEDGRVAAVTGGAGDLPPAPWRAAPVPRADVPPVYVAAWDRAENRATCAVLFPLDGGAVMKGAEATREDTPGDRGWDISLTAEAGTVQILGLFDKAMQAGAPAGPATFNRRWADGSVAKYAADVGDLAPGTFDPNSSPFEAVLTLPDQTCAYRIFDTLGKDHLEMVFDRLRLMTR